MKKYLYLVGALSLASIAFAQQFDSEGNFDFSASPVLTVSNQSDGQRAGQGSFTILDSGNIIELTGNEWNRFSLEDQYLVTENTVLEVTINVTSPANTLEEFPEIIAIALHRDANTNGNPQFALQLGGQDQWSRALNADLEAYTVNDNGIEVTYVVNVGDFYTGNIDFLTLISDDDVVPRVATTTFSNLRLYENITDTGALNVENRVTIGRDAVISGDVVLSVDGDTQITGDLFLSGNLASDNTTILTPVFQIDSGSTIFTIDDESQTASFDDLDLAVDGNLQLSGRIQGEATEIPDIKEALGEGGRAEYYGPLETGKASSEIEYFFHTEGDDPNAFVGLPIGQYHQGANLKVTCSFDDINYVSATWELSGMRHSNAGSFLPLFPEENSLIVFDHKALGAAKDLKLYGVANHGHTHLYVSLDESVGLTRASSMVVKVEVLRHDNDTDSRDAILPTNIFPMPEFIGNHLVNELTPLKSLVADSFRNGQGLSSPRNVQSVLNSDLSLNGSVIITQPQGDLSSGIYGN